MDMVKVDITGLAGQQINLDEFETVCNGAMDSGEVKRGVGEAVMSDVRYGVRPPLDEDKLRGIVYQRNYKSARDNREKMTSALAARVKAGKTIRLGNWNGDVSKLSFLGSNARVVPLGSVPKKLEPTKVRPFNDHSATGFNEAVDGSKMQFTMDTYNEIARELKYKYYMRVEDVDGAFPILGWHPTVYRFMLCHWYDTELPLDEQDRENTLYVHVFGDFGTQPMPFHWDRFYWCVKGMARSVGALTSPMPHFVDDCALIGRRKRRIDRGGDRMRRFLRRLGIIWKKLKAREAARKQLVLGLWWDSIERTRTLEKPKLEQYLDNLRSTISSRAITLKEMQVLSGQVQRAALTMPARSVVFLAGILSLMKGLTLPWQKRRITARVRSDLRSVLHMLEENQGRGYFSYDQFDVAPWVATDSAKDGRRAGGGFFTEDGIYGAWKFGASDAKKPIDYLEGKSVLIAAQYLGHTWYRKIVPLLIDNTAFQLSLVKGRSKAERLNELLRDLFYLSVKHHCIFRPTWIATDDNVFADALSRAQWSRFFEAVSTEPMFAGISPHWSGVGSPPGEDLTLQGPSLR